VDIFLHELKYYIRNIKEAIYIYSFFISIMLLAPFGLRAGGEAAELSLLAPVFLWIALAMAVALAGADLFTRDMENGRCEWYQMLPVALEAVVFAKWLAFFLFIAVPLMGALPLAAILFHIAPAALPHYAIGLGLGAAALTLVTSLASVLVAGMGKSGAVLSLLVLPLSIPIMIFGADYCQKTGSLWQVNLLFLGGFTLFLLPILLFSGASSIRASN